MRRSRASRMSRSIHKLEPTPASCQPLIASLLSSPAPQDLLVSLSTLLRGSVYDRLSWIFKLYDVNGDGLITKRELHDIIASVYDIVGRDTSPVSCAYKSVPSLVQLGRRGRPELGTFLRYPKWAGCTYLCDRESEVVGALD